MIHLRSNKIIIPDTIVAAIKGYTAMGGELSAKYPYNIDMQTALYDYVSDNTLTLTTNIYRKIDLSRADYESIFNELYDTGSFELEFTRLQSFSKNKHRVFTFGGAKQDYIIVQINSGVTVHGLDISSISVYPQEAEVLLGRNKFTVYYDDIDWTSDTHLILCVAQS